MDMGHQNWRQINTSNYIFETLNNNKILKNILEMKKSQKNEEKLFRSGEIITHIYIIFLYTFTNESNAFSY